MFETKLLANAVPSGGRITNSLASAGPTSGARLATSAATSASAVSETASHGIHARERGVGFMRYWRAVVALLRAMRRRSTTSSRID